MSTFAVEVRTVDRVANHPNADKLDIVWLRGLGYQFITQRDTFKEGQYAVYFPIDAVVPEELQLQLGLPKPRIKAVRLRGVYSEGFVCPPSSVNLAGVYELMDVTQFLGVTKYEPPIQRLPGGTGSRPQDLMALPIQCYVYDIENAQRYVDAYADLAARECVITEKVEGSHFWIMVEPDGTQYVGQRRFAIKHNPDHVFYRTAYAQDLDVIIERLRQEYPGYAVTMRGEIIGEGIQGNYYGITGHRICIFEIEVNGVPVDTDVFWYLVDRFSIPAVPIVGWLPRLGDTMPTVESAVKVANDFSQINPEKLREGIVIKPIKEAYNPHVGRLFLKIRDPIYLSGDKS